MIVNEIFGPTIQGEGPTAGQQAIFLRLFGCNLKCNFCFGIKPGRKIPKLITAENKNKHINKVEVGDILLTLDDNHDMVETTVKEVINRKVEQWYEVKIDGSWYFVTPEHPFFTTNGLKQTKELNIGDKIFHITYHQKISYSKLGKRNPMKNPKVVQKRVNNTDYVATGKKLSKTITKKKERGEYVSSWNRMTKEQQVAMKEKLRKNRMGENNPNWNGTKLKYINFLTLKDKIKAHPDKYVCEICKGENDSKLEIHHKDESHENDNPSNLQIVCHKCHSNIHKRGYNFWNGKRTDDKVSLSGAEAVHNGKVVEEIKYVDINDYDYISTKRKPLEVWNVSCAPYNTYLIDYMWVHNCDTWYTWRVNEKYPNQYGQTIEPQNESTRMGIEEVASLVNALGNQMLVITGGEPLLQQKEIADLIPLLHFDRIEIETAGTIFPTIKYDHLFYNVSPKLSNSGNEVLDRYKPRALRKFVETQKAIFKFVVSSEDDFAEIEEFGLPKFMTWIMPMTGPEHVIDTTIIEKAIDLGYHISPRLHVDLWGEQRGV